VVRLCGAGCASVESTCEILTQGRTERNLSAARSSPLFGESSPSGFTPFDEDMLVTVSPR